MVTQIPDAEMLNGMASMPAQPHIVLIADSRLGSIFRVDTETGDSGVVFEDETLKAPVYASLSIGVYGLQILGTMLFFTNSARNIFGRVGVSGDGRVFAFHGEGNAHVAQSDSANARIRVDGRQRIVAGGGDSWAYFCADCWGGSGLMLLLVVGRRVGIRLVGRLLL
jgi:hypothetical protein